MTKLSKDAKSLLDSMMTYYNQEIINKLPPPLYDKANKLWRECWNAGSALDEEKRMSYQKPLTEIEEFCKGWLGDSAVRIIKHVSKYPFDSIEILVIKPMPAEVLDELHKQEFVLDDVLPPFEADKRPFAQLTFKREVFLNDNHK